MGTSLDRPGRSLERFVYSVVMIWPERLILLAFIIVFAAGVTCAVICPERPIVPAKSHQENGPCTDCTSTDFVGGAKIPVEKASLNATADLALGSSVASSLRLVSLALLVSTSALLEPSPAPVVPLPILRL
jgi:hypothetical protein